MSSNATSSLTVAHQDVHRFEVGRTDLKNIGEAGARKLMSVEHKALGYRPPPGSLAAEAQAAAAKHPRGAVGLDEELLKKVAEEDAARIKEQRTATNVVDLAGIGEAEAQSAASHHSNGSAHHAQRSALEDASKVPNAKRGLDLNYIGEAEARKLMSEEHKALGYRPPPGSLAAEAQSAASKHPNARAGVDGATLAKVAVEDAKKIETKRKSSSPSISPKLNLRTITTAEAHALQSEEQENLRYWPSSSSKQAQSIMEKRGDEAVTKEFTIEFEEQTVTRHRPENGSLAAVAQSLAEKNENDGGDRNPMGEFGL
ncbi:hypothetical protein AcW1_002134 [Taiwanofungus camphoratus]|nr:hypothetical protein AcV5_010130 [Antrodia cinnamomea]KAI0944418.1 hypothetical protein AcW1_002134 [Antrodia cinnamomea]